MTFDSDRYGSAFSLLQATAVLDASYHHDWRGFGLQVVAHAYLGFVYHALED